jgi:hypothetical protein
VPLDAHLIVADAGAKVPAAHAANMIWLENVGLDRTTGGRGIAIIPAGKLTANLFHIPNVRVYKPITPRVGEK